MPYPQKFKPSNINKFDGKSDPTQWLRCYSAAISLAGGNNDIKAIYFPMLLGSTHLTWQKQLQRGSIDSWSDLKKKLIDNYQSVWTHSANRHDL